MQKTKDKIFEKEPEPKKDFPWKEAAIEVLKANGNAMHYADVAKEIQKQGLRAKVGATPAMTVNAIIHDSLKKEGAASPFVKVGVGEFFLKDALPAAAAAAAAVAAQPKKPQRQAVSSKHSGCFGNEGRLHGSRNPRSWDNSKKERIP